MQSSFAWVVVVGGRRVWAVLSSALSHQQLILVQRWQTMSAPKRGADAGRAAAVNFPVFTEGKELQVTVRNRLVPGSSVRRAAVLEQCRDLIIVAQLSRSSLAWHLGRSEALPVAAPPARPRGYGCCWPPARGAVAAVPFAAAGCQRCPVDWLQL